MIGCLGKAHYLTRIVCTSCVTVVAPQGGHERLHPILPGKPRHNEVATLARLCFAEVTVQRPVFRKWVRGGSLCKAHDQPPIVLEWKTGRAVGSAVRAHIAHDAISPQKGMLILVALQVCRACNPSPVVNSVSRA